MTLKQITLMVNSSRANSFLLHVIALFQVLLNSDQHHCSVKCLVQEPQQMTRHILAAGKILRQNLLEMLLDYLFSTGNSYLLRNIYLNGNRNESNFIIAVFFKPAKMHFGRLTATEINWAILYI